LIQDTATPWEFSDEEINFMVSDAGSAEAASIELLDTLATKYTAMAESESTSALSRSWGNRAEKYRAQADRLRARSQAPVPYCAGISLADKDIDEADTDMVGSRFTRGQFRDPDLT